MNVHPSAVVNPRGPPRASRFSSKALYELKVDYKWRCRRRHRISGALLVLRGRHATATVRRVEGALAAGTGDGGQVVIEAAPVSTGRDARVYGAGRYRFFAGWRSDPFFFDTRGALNDLQFTAMISSSTRTCAASCWNAQLCPWTQPSRPLGAHDGWRGGVWVQADRGALPAQAVFLVGSERDGYHAGEPANDARFIAVFAHALEHAGGYSPAEARRVAERCCPTCCPTIRRAPRPFTSNGRTLTDDAADAFLPVLTNGKVPGDKVGPHIDLLASFPYLDHRHNSYVRATQLRLSQTEPRKAFRSLGSS